MVGTLRFKKTARWELKPVIAEISEWLLNSQEFSHGPETPVFILKVD